MGVEHIHGLQIVGRREIFNSASLAFPLQLRGPLPWQTGFAVDLANAFLPCCLVRNLTTQVLEAVLADDLGGTKILELCGVCPSLGTETDQQLGAFQIAVLGVRYQSISGRINLEPDRIRIDQARLLDNHQSELTVSGELAVHEREVGTVEIDVKADDFKVIDNKLGSVRVRSDLQLTGELTAPRVEGTLDVTTGQRTLVREMGPRDMVGVDIVNDARLTPDGKSYAYVYIRSLYSLYQVTGLK